MTNAVLIGSGMQLLLGLSNSLDCNISAGYKKRSIGLRLQTDHLRAPSLMIRFVTVRAHCRLELSGR